MQLNSFKQRPTKGYHETITLIKHQKLEQLIRFNCQQFCSCSGECDENGKKQLKLFPASNNE
jgi:hypothetical protein